MTPAPEACSFCRIALGEEPALLVLEEAAFVAFLDRRPLFPGHCLLVPRQHVETLTELPAALAGPLVAAMQLLTQAVEEAVAAEGSFLAVNNRVSQSVPHLHVHVVPRRRGDGLHGFFWPRRPYPDSRTAREVQTAIRIALGRLGSA